MKRKEFATSEDSNVSPAFNSQLLESDLGIIASHVFGHESLKTIFSSGALSQEVNQKSILQNSNVWVHRVLEGMDPVTEEDCRPGRLGLPQVRFDSTAQVGTLIMSADRLHVQAQSNFSSVRANVCFYSGQWQYELQLESKGVMQLGWTMADGDFSPETGVGDSVYSYSFDGNRVRKWNLVTTEYGEAWQVGDIIGCTIDLQVGSIHYYRNGKDLGEAFSSIPLGPGCAYYPAISLAFEEKVQANFGALPFKYPVEGYLPAQQPPTGALLRTNQLLHWLFRVSSVPKTKSSIKGKGVENQRKKQSPEAVKLMICELLLSYLSPWLSRPFVIQACLLPFLRDITSVSPDRKSLPSSRSVVKLNYVCDSLLLLLEPDDFKELINAICKSLVQKFNQTSSSLEYTAQKNSLALFSDICQNTNIRRSLLKQPGFVKTRIPELMDLKPIDMLALKLAVPESWWNSEDVLKGALGHKEYEARKKNYLGNCHTIKTKAMELEALQESVLLLFLNNTDRSSTEASSRKCFLHMFRTFLRDNHITGLNNQNVEQTPLPIALSYFHRLVNVLRRLWEKECGTQPVCVPLTTFYNGSVDYFSTDRLGGVLSHLVHTHHTTLAAELGADHRVLAEPATPAASQPSVQVQVRGIDTNTGVVTTLTRWINANMYDISGPLLANREPATLAAEPLPDSDSLTELLDGLIMLYNLAAHKQLHKISSLRDEMDKYIVALNEASTRLRLAKETCPEASVEIETSIKTFESRLEDQSRVLLAWVRGAVFTPDKRADLVWLLRAVLLTLETASQRGDMFVFVPDFYVDTLVELCTALRNYFSPTLPLDELAGYKLLLVQVAEFLVKHFVDPRVVNLSSKDTMIEALAGFITNKLTMDCLESISPKSQEMFVRLLLKPYDNRPWGQSNWIIMRMWQGCGFAFRYQKSPHLSRKLGPRTPSSDSGLLIHQAFEPCPSKQYQELIAKLLCQDQEMAAGFLNSVLKQLNWSFSEFISMMQEIQNLSKRPERVIIDARQLKICATCFDFVLSLLRVLEMLCTICLPVFTDASRESTENLLERLCQLLSQILLRVTTPTGCFSHVISLEVPDLDAIDQFPVLSAVVGVLLALLAEDITDKENTTMSAAAISLLSEPAFQIDSLKYVLGETEPENEKQEIFSLGNYPVAVTKAELEAVSHLVTVLTKYQARMSTAKDVDDEELCPICCAMPLAVTFMPCHHRSCKSCITHHLMDCKECFFCKTAIKTVVATDGKLLFDSAASAHKVADLERSPL